MIQFNLLPDVKLEYIRSKYLKRIIILVSVVASAALLAIFLLLFIFVRFNQTRHISNVDKDIDKSVQELKSNPDLNKILTIQNQLNSLPALHEQKVFTSRLFLYLTQLTPQEASISNVELDTEAHTLSLKGEADNLATINKFVDTIKFTDFTMQGDESKQGKAFSAVVLQSFSVGAGVSTRISYQIDFAFDPIIFSDTASEGNPTNNAVKLTVPQIITTRSETQKPSALFKPSTAPETLPRGAQ